MAWNEPGGSKDKDPWGNGGDNSGPPDLDEVVRKFQKKLSGIFGGGQGGDQNAGGSGGGKSVSSSGIIVILMIGLVIWALSGLYIIDEGKRGVVLRFGEYVDTTHAGLHWHIPFPVDQVEIVNVDKIRTIEIGYRSGAGGKQSRSVPREALMLTQDENIIDIEFAIQYRVNDARDYLFNMVGPDLTLKQVIESSVRELIGKRTMDFVLTEGRSEIVTEAKIMIQEVLNNYKVGLEISSVNMQNAQPPDQVQAAFSDAVKAREDKERIENEAEAYKNDILPKARGRAARMLEEANAYKDQVIAEAKGEASRFTQVLAEYKKAPKVTRERLYLDSIEQVMSSATKVMIDVEGGNNLLYLPFDKLMGSSSSQITTDDLSVPVQPGRASAADRLEQTGQRFRSSTRQREQR